MSSIRFRVLVLLALFTVITLAVGGALFTYARQQVTDYQWNLLTARANERLREVTLWIREREDEARVFWIQPSIRQTLQAYLERDKASGPEWHGFETQVKLLLSRGSYQDIAVLDARGEVRYHQGAPITDLSAYRHAAAEALQQRRVIFRDITVPVAHGSEVRVVMVLPLFGKEEQQLGALAFRIEPYLYNAPLVEEWPAFKSTAEVLVFRRQGDKIVFLTQPRFRRVDAAQATPSLLAVQVVGEKGWMKGLDYRGEPAIGVGRRIPNTPWYLVAKVDEAEVEGVLREIAVVALLLILLILAAGAVVAEALVRRQVAEARYRAQEEKQASLRAAQLQLIQSEKLAALGTLVAGIAHELNNPLMGVMNYVAFARRHVQDPELQRPLESADHELKRIRDLLKSMLIFAAPSAGALAAVNMKTVLTRTVELLAPEFRASHIEFGHELPDELPRVSAQAGQLQQVFVNLLLNARDAVAKSAEKRVSLRAYASEDTLVVEVRDTGEGIPDTIRGRIFDPFFTTKPVGQGTGLGLSLAQSIVHELKGSIGVQSSPGAGTTFIVTLPGEPRGE